MYITIVSDVHLAEFTNYSFYEGFRNEQFSRLADRIIEESEKRGSKHLLLAGDIIDHPKLTSREEFLLARFIDKLCSYFTEIRYILGQHDLSYRNDIIEYEDSTVNIHDLYGKMKYSDDQVFELGGRKIYMRNWTPRQDKIVAPCPEKVDLFVGHVTITSLYQPNEFLHLNEIGEWEAVAERKSELDYVLYTGHKDQRMTAQKITLDTFKLGVFGDIHAPIDCCDSKIHSSGCPLQKSLSDVPYGTFSFVNLDDLSFERVKVIDDTHKFLRIYREDEMGEDEKDEYTWIVPRNEKVTSITLDKNTFGSEELKVSLNDISNIIRTQVEMRGLSEVHEQFDRTVVKRDPVSLNFRLISLEIDNFRSIDHCELNFEKLPGVKYIHGKNGAGKSSLMSALKVALLGDRKIKDSRSVSSDDKARVKVALEYNNTRYDIERAEGQCNFYVNGKLNNGSGKVDTEAKIYQTLPFLNYLDSFFISHNNPFYLRFKSSKLLENMFNLDVLVQYSTMTSESTKTTKSQIKKVENEISAITGSLDSTKKEIAHVVNRLGEISYQEDFAAEQKRNVCLGNPRMIKDKTAVMENVQSKIEPNPYTMYSNVLELREQHGILKQKVEDFTTADNTRARIQDVKKTIESKSITCENCGHVIEVGTQALNRELGELTNKLSELEKSTQGYTREQCVEKMQDIRQKYESCQKYLEHEKAQGVYKQNVEGLKAEIARLEEELREVIGDSTVDETLKYCDEQISLKNEVRVLNGNKARLDRELQSKIGNLADKTAELKELQRKLDNYNKYFELFSLKSGGSIYNAIIVKISETLSDESIQFSADEDGSLKFCLKVDNIWMDYSACSDGQKVLMDLLLLQRLSRLLGKIGFMGLDEVGANLDTSSYDRFSQIINEYDVTDMFVMMHNDAFSGYDHAIKVELIDNHSRFTIE